MTHNIISQCSYRNFFSDILFILVHKYITDIMLIQTFDIFFYHCFKVMYTVLGPFFLISNATINLIRLTMPSPLIGSRGWVLLTLLNNFYLKCAISAKNVVTKSRDYVITIKYLVIKLLPYHPKSL